MSTLRVELFWDEEAGNWHYRVPALHINGGGTATREEAEREALSAIAFALEGDPRDYDPSSEAVALDVTVAPAA
jgi:predicted RNase H-like HicB family nuclease